MDHKLLFSAAGVATQILVKDKNVMILLDVGDGILRDLLNDDKNSFLNVSLHLFITHGHYDHCGGLFSLLGFLRMLGFNRNINIYYPGGAIEVEGIIKAFKASYSSTIPYNLNQITIKANKEEFAINRTLKVVAYQMRHAGSILSYETLPEIPAFGYAIIKGNKKVIAYSGDTGMNENLIDLITNADYAYIEATHETTKETALHLNSQQATMLGKLAVNYQLIHKRFDTT